MRVLSIARPRRREHPHWPVRHGSAGGWGQRPARCPNQGSWDIDPAGIPAGRTSQQSTPDGRPWPQQEECTLAKATAIATKLRPLGDRVVIKPSAREEMTKSGIVLPDTAKEKPQEGTIIAAGPGKILDDGKRESMDVKERRQGPVRQVRRDRVQDRRRRAAHRQPEGHPGDRRRLTASPSAHVHRPTRSWRDIRIG